MKKIRKKLSICYQTTLNGGMLDKSNNKEPINQLLNNIEDIEYILHSGKQKSFNFFYFNWKTIHDILYEEDKLFHLENNNISFQLSDFFYIDIIIIHYDDIVEFKYSLKLIEKINEIQDKIKEAYNLKKLIWAKIIIDLINHFQKKEDEDNNDEDEEILKRIKINNEKIIKSNLDYIKNNFQNLENLFKKETKIDEIYSFIFAYLIKNNKFDDYKYVSSIFEQLELKNIELTITIINNLKEILQSKECNNYKVSKLEDIINDNTKINFYYLIYEYILKYSFYIYQLDFFIDFRNIIISSLKSNPELINLSLNNKNNNDKNRLISIINFYTDSNYFYEKYIEEIEMKEIYNNYSLSVDFSKNKFFYEITKNFNDKLRKLNENEIYNYKWKNIFIKYKTELNKLIENLRKYLLYKNFIIRFEPKIKNNIKKIFLFLYLFQKLSTGESELLKSFCLKIELEREINKTQGFLYLIKYIKKIIEQPISKKQSRDESKYSFSTSSLSLSNESNSYTCKFYKFSKIQELLNKKNKYEILIIERIIYQHTSSVETILELNNCYLSVDLNNSISLYNNNFVKINLNLPLIKALDSELNIKEKDIILSSNNGVHLFKFNNILPQIDSIIELKNEPATVFFVMDNKMILGNKNHIKIFYSLTEEKVLAEISVVAGIKVDNNNIIFISNSILSNGQDKIFLYDNLNENISIIKLSDNYSFNPSSNNLALMPNKKGIKIFLLCGCKNKNNENGIIIFNISSFEEIFLPTYNFEVFCFCPIFIVKEGKNNKIKNYYTNYFFAGGFEKNKFKGAIKLYKLVTDDENDIKRIEFIQDINFEDRKIEKIYTYREKINDSGNIKEICYNKIENYSFTGFEKNINSITQSKKTGKIIIII